MSLKQWTPIVLVIGAGYFLQSPRHDGPPGPGHVAVVESADAIAEAPGPYRTVELEVTGMT